MLTRGVGSGLYATGLLLRQPSFFAFRYPAFLPSDTIRALCLFVFLA